MKSQLSLHERIRNANASQEVEKVKTRTHLPSWPRGCDRGMGRYLVKRSELFLGTYFWPHERF